MSQKDSDFFDSNINCINPPTQKIIFLEIECVHWIPIMITTE